MACLCAVLVGAGILLIARYFSLKKRNLRALDAEVVNICTIKPLDEELIVKTASKTGKVVTAEEHNIIGGLGGAVAECLAEKCPTKMYRIGVRDKFGESGSAAVLLHKYELDGEGVYKQVKAFVESC